MIPRYITPLTNYSIIYWSGFQRSLQAEMTCCALKKFNLIGICFNLLHKPKTDLCLILKVKITRSPSNVKVSQTKEHPLKCNRSWNSLHIWPAFYQFKKCTINPSLHSFLPPLPPKTDAGAAVLPVLPVATKMTRAAKEILPPAVDEAQVTFKCILWRKLPGILMWTCIHKFKPTCLGWEPTGDARFQRSALHHLFKSPLHWRCIRPIWV